MFEQLPTPFGLSRYGVAPDHPEVKNCEETFTEAAKNKRFTFYGNTQVGKDVSIQELHERFNGIVFAYGCSEGNKLGIKGEKLPGVINAHEFVGWYNGNPTTEKFIPPLDRVQDVVIIGNGNVAMDIARLLLMPVEELEVTDMTQHAIRLLKKSTVKNVRIVARRGVVESAFTTKEIRELLQLEQFGVKFMGLDDEVFQILMPIKNKLERILKRKFETILEHAKPIGERKGKAKYVIPDEFTKFWKLDYLLSPVEIKPHSSDLSLVSEIVFQKNRLYQDSPESPVKVKPIPNTFKSFKADLVITSLGFRGTPIAGLDEVGIKFDGKRGVIMNQDSRVMNDASEVIPGFYTTGWIKNSKKGPIVNTLVDSNTVAVAIMKDYTSGVIKRETEGSKGLEITDATNWEDWQSLNEFELGFGELHGKTRWKVPEVSQMLNIIKDDTPQKTKITKFGKELEDYN
jgi:adrenodoxin-NADP+ reductase